MFRLTSSTDGTPVFVRSIEGLMPDDDGGGGTILLDPRGKRGLRVAETVPMILRLKRLWGQRQYHGGAPEEDIVAIGYLRGDTKPVYLTAATWSPNDLENEPIA